MTLKQNRLVLKGRYLAYCMSRVRKMPPGSAVFETISEELYNGIVVCPLQQISPQAVTNGVLSFREDDQPAKIMFGQHDIKVSQRTSK